MGWDSVLFPNHECLGVDHYEVILEGERAPEAWGDADGWPHHQSPTPSF